MSTPKLVAGDINWNPDSEAAHATGGYSVGFPLMVVQVNVLGSVLFICYFLIKNGLFSDFLLETELFCKHYLFHQSCS